MEVTIAADLTSIAKFAKTLDKDGARGVRRQVQKAVRVSGKKVLQDAKANASWSTGHTSRQAKTRRWTFEGTKILTVGNVHQSIPSAIGMRTVFNDRSARVTLRVDKKKAPHGYYWERGSKNGGGSVLRHPVFGRKDKPNDWKQSSTRPFFYKAAAANRDAFTAQMKELLADLLRSITTAA